MDAFELKNNRWILILMLIVASLFVLFLSIWKYKSAPAKHETNVNADEYLKVNKYVADCICDFSGSLPDEIPDNTSNADYYYYYGCALLGDPTFIIDLKLEFDKDVSMLDEIRRLEGLSPEQIIESKDRKTFVYNCSPLSLDYYYDDEVYDGTILEFELVTVDVNSRTIEYLTAAIQDNFGRSDIISAVIKHVE